MEETVRQGERERDEKGKERQMLSSYMFKSQWWSKEVPFLIFSLLEFRSLFLTTVLTWKKCKFTKSQMENLCKNETVYEGAR